MWIYNAIAGDFMCGIYSLVPGIEFKELNDTFTLSASESQILATCNKLLWDRYTQILHLKYPFLKPIKYKYK